ncbi:hypothetical protein DKX38_028439 [Salix brachista]|uniref:GH18 domain-containing protein n=1 Tax=Salix brachista TaxID=2182728 RepID=A0A5N5JAS1_9ROSI|nr:hypothetical protein DKX38_028439 [Salix brachista]
MVSRIAIIILFHVFLSLNSHPAKAQAWIKAGYWYYDNGLPVSQINSTLYTHLICAFANLNSSSYRLSIPSSDDFSAFTNTVKQKNPSITTLLSIGGGRANYSTISAMAGNSTYRKSFIDDSIKTARHYGFQGLDFSWLSANTSDNMANMGTLFEDWRAAIALETRNSSLSELILTAAVQWSPTLDDVSFPIDSIRRNLNWIHVLAYDYYLPEGFKFTAASAALYAPDSDVCTDTGIGAWIIEGLPASKLVLGLPFFGYAWKLANPTENSIGAPATGPAVTKEGDMSYKEINNYSKTQGAVGPIYNSYYVVNYLIVGSDWISFDGVDVVRIKVSYAKEKALLGYVVWEISQDDNWVLSQAAGGVGSGGGVDHKQKRLPKSRILIIILTTTAAVIIVLGLAFYFIRIRILKSKSKGTKLKVNNAAAAGDFHNNNPDMKAYELWKDGRGMEIMDPSLDDTFSSCKLIKCLQIALLCVQENPADRPSMLEVSSMLRNETAIVTIPRRPAFSVKTDEDDKNRRDRLHLEICSVDDATITQAVGR